MTIEKILSNYLESNMYVLGKDDQVLFIDAGCEVDRVERVVGERKVQGILLTHGHYDHAIFARECAEKFGTKVYCMKEAFEILADSEANYSEGHLVIDDFSNFVAIEEGKLTLGNFEIQVYKTPGHTKDSAGYLIEGNYFAGDTLFDEGVGRTDLISSDKAQMVESLEKIEEIPFEMVYCGHGESSKRKQQKRNIKVFKKFLTRRK